MTKLIQIRCPFVFTTSILALVMNSAHADEATNRFPVSQLRQFDRKQNRFVEYAEFYSREQSRKTSGLKSTKIVQSEEENGSKLKPIESANTEKVRTSTVRSKIPEPMIGLTETFLEKVIQRKQSELSFAEVRKQLTQAFPFYPASSIENWDQNKNQTLNHAELRTGLQQDFGIWHPDGFPLRKENGLFFSLRSFHQADSDHNQKLSRSEFITCVMQSTDEEHSLFEQLDSNKNGNIELTEFSQSELFWTDIKTHFKMFDQNSDQQVSEEEIIRHSKPWELPLAQRVMHSFDRNNDFLLSFEEFQFTPFSNFSSTWVEAEDMNLDGTLSFSEFSAQFTEVPEGECSWMFNNFDRNSNQSLSIQEYPIKIDFEKISPAVAFHLYDTNVDQQLTILEAAGPRPIDRKSSLRHQAKITRIEEIWRIADEDKSQMLSEREFAKHYANLSAAMHLKKMPRSTLMSERPPAPLSKQKSDQPQIEQKGQDWRIAILIAFNIIITLAIIYMITQPKSSLKMQDDED